MSELVLVFSPERDWQMQVGDIAVLNSGGPTMAVVEVLEDGRRACVWDGGYAEFFSEMIRPPFNMRILMTDCSR